MPSFGYKAKTRSGETVRGVIEVSDIHAAQRRLREEGYFVLSLEAKGEGGGQWWNPFFLFMRYVIKPIFAGATVLELAVFYRQLASMIRSGISLVQSMHYMAEQGEAGSRLRKIAAETATWMEEGGALSDAFARYPWMFSNLQISILRAGEVSGDLEGSTDRIAHYLEWENSLRLKVRIATLYPKILVVAVIFIPNIVLLFTNGSVVYLQATMGVFVPIVVGILVLWIAYRLLSQIGTVRYFLDMFKLTVPKIGKMIKLLALSKFYRSFSAMYSAGVPLSQGLQYAAESMGNGYLSKNILTAIPKVERGIPLSDCLIQTRVLPRMANDMLRTGKHTGNVDEMMNKLAEYTENETEVQVIQTTVVLGVLLLLIIGAYIGSVVIRFYAGQAQSINNSL